MNFVKMWICRLNFGQNRKREPGDKYTISIRDLTVTYNMLIINIDPYNKIFKTMINNYYYKNRRLNEWYLNNTVI